MSHGGIRRFIDLFISNLTQNILLFTCLDSFQGTKLSVCQGTRLKMMDKQVIEVETESETSSIIEGQNERQGNLDNLMQNVPEVITDIIERASSPCCMSNTQEQLNIVAQSKCGSRINVTADVR